MLSKSPHISLQLLEPTIYTEQHQESVIRGSVSIDQKAVTIQRIVVQFNGKMETKGHYHSKTVANEQLTLYDSHHHHTLTQLGFEMQIPSGLPESIECSEVKVSYHVSCLVQYSTRHPVLKRSSCHTEQTRQPIRVARLPQRSILTGEANNFIDSRTHQSTWLCYQLLVDRKAVALGSVLPITFRLLPVTAISIDRVTVQMLERRHRLDNTTYSVCTMPPCCDIKQDTVPTELSEAWEGTVYYRVPCGKTMVHSTRPYSEFHVDHCILVSIGFSVPDNKRRTFGSSRIHKLISFKANIDVLDKTIVLDSLELPSYHPPPPFDYQQTVYGEYDRKFVEPPPYEEIDL